MSEPIKSEEKKEGWGVEKPDRKKTYCYYVGSTSLCRKWGFYFGEVEQGEDDHPDNCKACKKKLKKRQATKNE